MLNLILPSFLWTLYSLQNQPQVATLKKLDRSWMGINPCSNSQNTLVQQGSKLADQTPRTVSSSRSIPICRTDMHVTPFTPNKETYFGNHFSNRFLASSGFRASFFIHPSLCVMRCTCVSTAMPLTSPHAKSMIRCAILGPMPGNDT